MWYLLSVAVCCERGLCVCEGEGRLDSKYQTRGGDGRNAGVRNAEKQHYTKNTGVETSVAGRAAVRLPAWTGAPGHGLENDPAAGRQVPAAAAAAWSEVSTAVVVRSSKLPCRLGGGDGGGGGGGRTSSGRSTNETAVLDVCHVQRVLRV